MDNQDNFYSKIYVDVPDFKIAEEAEFISSVKMEVLLADPHYVPQTITKDTLLSLMRSIDTRPLVSDRVILSSIGFDDIIWDDFDDAESVISDEDLLKAMQAVKDAK